MSEKRTVVLTEAHASDRLPEWATEGAVIVAALDQAGTLSEVAQRLRIQREGGYAGVDVFLFFTYFFGSGPGTRIKRFGEDSRPYRNKLAALGGRKKLASPSSISRALSAVEPELVAPFEQWVLMEAADVRPVLRHPSVMSRDALGEGWHVFDWDPTVKTLRQRALPAGEDLPPGRRRSAEMAAPGYSGRKRGEVQVSRAALQHAGSGLWLYLRMDPGNGDPRGTLGPALDAVLDACEKADAPPERALFRADGAHGHVPFITACEEASVCYLTRLARYELLHEPDIIRHLNQADWHRVPSSGSGPDRQAADLGWVMLRAGRDTLRDDGTRYADVEIRVVVSRFPASTGRGAGVVLDGWHYELFATNVDPVPWPGAELVSGYYGRSGIENRFAQEDHELGLDRIFSYHLPGQELATAIGLFLWNWRICQGMTLVEPPVELPPQPLTSPQLMPPAPGRLVGPATDQDNAIARDEPDAAPAQERSPEERSPVVSACEDPGEFPVAQVPLEPIATDAPTGGAGNVTTPEAVAPFVTSVPTADHAQAELREALDALDWPTWLQSHPGWSWNSDDCALRCPQGQLVSPKRIEDHKRNHPLLRLEASLRSCARCPLRQACLGSYEPTRGKRVAMSIPDDQARAIGGRFAQLSVVPKPPGRKLRRSRCPPVSVKPGRARRPVRDKRSPNRAPVAWMPPDLLLLCGLYAVTAACLLPRKLRQAVEDACKAVEARVTVSDATPEPKPVPIFAYSDGERQHRRLTWDQRLAWNRQPASTQVTLTLAGGHRLEWLLPSPRSETMDKVA